MTDSTPAIVVDHVSKRFRLYHEQNRSLKIWLMRRRRAIYEEFWAVNDVSLDIPHGATVGLIGENGSGKSTLLKCMAHILRPDQGTITADGRVSALLELGAGFHPELSGRENVHLNASILGLSKREVDARFDHIVEFAGLERFIDTPVKNYSSGMYVRLGFSVAINVDPDILLVDEVLAVGDEQFQRKCFERFADLKAKGKTVVLVSHSLGSIRQLCDLAAWMEHGELRMYGAPKDVIAAYVGEVEAATIHDEQTRFGSGEVVITGVDFIDEFGRPATPRSGGSLTIRIHYDVKQPVTAVFGVSVDRDRGMLAVTDTRQQPAHLEPGHGSIEVRIEHLNLLAGSYDLNPSVWNRDVSQPYDAIVRGFRLDVAPGDYADAEGVFLLPATWGLPAPDAVDARG